MATYFYSSNAGIRPLSPNTITVATSAPTADVYVQVSTANSGVVTDLEVRLILEAIMQLIQSRGVGTSQTGGVDLPAPVYP